MLLDRIAALILAAQVALSSLPLSATALVGTELVTRSSLDGYDVGGQHGLDAAEAAQTLAERAVAEMDAAAADCSASRLHQDLLKPPHRSLGKTCEVWKAGAAANRRLYALSQTAIARYVERHEHTPRGFFAGQKTVAIYYPAGHVVPAIEVMS